MIASWCVLWLFFTTCGLHALKPPLRQHRISTSPAFTSTQNSDKYPINFNSWPRISPLVLLPIPALVLAFHPPAADASSLTTWIEPALPHHPSTAWKYFLSGGISACFSHAITVPFDVVKTKMQTSEKYGGQNVLAAARNIVVDEGRGSLLTGLLPTSVGFFIHGSLKYGLYEVFKPLVKLWLLQEGVAADQLVIFVLAALLAESLGCITLGPFEATRIRMVSEPGFARSSWEGGLRLVRQEGAGALFRSLPPLLLKNVPYTVLQLSSFESASSAAYSFLASRGVPGSEALHFQLEITALSALLAAASPQASITSSCGLKALMLA